MKKYALLASAASLFAATSAIAADLPSRKVAPVAPIAPAFTWTGFYAGVNAGVNWSSRNVTPGLSTADPTWMTNAELAPFVPAPFSNQRTGFIGGVQIGYNYQINQFVIGAEADFMGTASSKTSSNSVTIIDPMFEVPSVTLSSAKVEQNWLGTVRARVGFAADRALFYATGGLAYGNAKVTTAAVNSLPSLEYAGSWAGSKTSTKAGYAVGAGVEYAFTNNWVLRAEYLYYNLGSVSATALATTEVNAGVIGPNETPAIGTAKTTIDGNIVRAALSYKF